MQDRHQGTTSVTTLQGRGCLQQPLSCTFSKLGRVCGLQRRGAFLVTFNPAVLTTMTAAAVSEHVLCAGPHAMLFTLCTHLVRAGAWQQFRAQPGKQHSAKWCTPHTGYQASPAALVKPHEAFAF